MKRTSIAARLFLLVFGFSVAWFTLTTGVQLGLEYRNTRVEVDSNLKDLFTVTRAGLESALWNYDLDLVRNSLAAARSVSTLSGALVLDENGTALASWGDRPSGRGRTGRSSENVDAWAETLYHQFPLQYTDRDGRSRTLGTLFLVSGGDVLGKRLGDSFRLILSNYLASTLGFLVILVVGLRRLVARPLGRVTRAIEAYRFDRDSLQPFASPRPDELSVLWKSFESLTRTLKENWLQQRVMSAILEEAAVMALVSDADGRIISSNAQARARLLGSEPGGELSRLSHGAEAGPLFKDVHTLLRSGRAWRGDITSEGAGQTFWLSAALLPLAVPDEPRARWGVMIEDWGAEKLTEHYRRERDVAQEAARAKSLFLANLSHELRTPMNAVVGLTKLALDEEVTPRVLGYLQPLERSAKALLGIINDILDYSKLEEGKVQLESLDFSLRELLDDVDAMVRFRAEEKGLALTFQGPDPSPLLRGDALRLQQVLLNLVANAIKFTHTGSISVRVASTETGWRFEVTDTGIGIAPQDQSRLFESFTQVDASTTRMYGGTGLGLSIVRELVHLMGGSVGVESAVGRGSLFWVEVPLLEGSELTIESKLVWKGVEGLRVLLVEDNRVNQLVAREILGKMGIVPVVVGNGVQALEKVGTEAFDLVLMDLQMPQMDGFEAARRIREHKSPEELPILAMTAHSDHEHEDSADAGMQAVVPKPVDPDQLFAALLRWRPY